MAVGAAEAHPVSWLSKAAPPRPSPPSKARRRPVWLEGSDGEKGGNMAAGTFDRLQCGGLNRGAEGLHLIAF